jgi:hypothetical protein
MSVKIGVTQEHDGRYVAEPGSSAGIKDERGEEDMSSVWPEQCRN